MKDSVAPARNAYVCRHERPARVSFLAMLKLFERRRALSTWRSPKNEAYWVTPNSSFKTEESKQKMWSVAD